MSSGGEESGTENFKAIIGAARSGYPRDKSRSFRRGGEERYRERGIGGRGGVG